MLSQGEPSKHQCIDDGIISLGSALPLPLDFVQMSRDPDDYYVSVFTFTDHKLDADHIEQGSFWRHFVMPVYFDSVKNIFYHSVSVALHGLIASLTALGIQYNFVKNCSCSNCKHSKPVQPQWLLDSGASMHFTGQRSDLINIYKLDKPIHIQMANNIAHIDQARTVFITHTVYLQNGKAYETTTRLEPIYFLHSTSISTWRFDGGSEFINHEFKNMLHDNGFQSETSVSYTHQQNGHAECLNCTIMDKVQSMHFHACLTNTMWEYSWDHTIHVYNHTPMTHLKWQTPFEALRHETPDVLHLHIFGCGAYVFLPEDV